MRYINGIYTTVVGERWANADVAAAYGRAIDGLDLDAGGKEALGDRVRYFLLGDRSRWAAPGWLTFEGFGERASAFEDGAEGALEVLAEEIREVGVVFDAVVTTTSTGNLMPGLSYRMARRLGEQVRADSAMIDLGNVGCTGGVKALRLVQGLDETFKNVLVVSVEQPSTLVNLRTADPDVWQGNCTFGDGAAAVWVSDDPAQGEMGVAMETLTDVQRADASDLIQWGYEDYYTFRLADEATFNRDVRRLVGDVLADVDPALLQTPHWAIHPAGLSLLLRLSRKLGLPREATRVSASHYERCSNMSSASLLHILKEVAAEAPTGADIHLLTMGAGFNVIHGRVRKER